ncbi:MAG: hypothetical protein E7680_07705 [Ruminococcaceae bacterium]|nr:hypothetical protein [Oscillospiraceae bacterium]
MKKIFCFIAFLLIALSLLPFSAFADNAPAFVVSNTNAAPGSQVDVEISVCNNPGIASIKLSVIYDSELVLDAITYNSSIGGQSQEPQTKTSPVTLNWFNGGENSNGDWVFATLHFTVPSEISDGTYPISVTYEADNVYNIAEENLDFAIENGAIKVAQNSSKITSAALALGKDITVNYYATLPLAQFDAQMRFTMNGKETIVDGTQEGNEYVFLFGVSPQCMGDNIKAELILGDEVLDTVETYSVRQNCLNLLSKNPSDELRTLIADLLEYGAMSQVYTNYKTDALVNEGVTGQTEFVPLADNIETGLYVTYDLDETSNEAYYLTAAGVYFDSVNQLYFKLYAEGVTDSNFEVVITDMQGNEARRLPSEFEEIGENLYMIYTDPIYASELSFSEEDGDYYWYSVSLNTVQIKKGKRVLTAVQELYNYSLASYVFGKQDDNDAMANLAKALYNYGLSAAAYLDAQ